MLLFDEDIVWSELSDLALQSMAADGIPEALVELERRLKES